MSRDRLFSIVAVALSVFLAGQAFTYPADSSQFPRFLCVLLVLFSLMSLIKAKRDESSVISFKGLLERIKIPFIVFASSLVYVAGIVYIGYIVSTVLYMIIMMFYFGERRIFSMALAVLIFLGSVYALFVSFLGMRLPTGFLF